MNDNLESDSAGPLGLDEAYAVKTPEDVRRLYAKWAATYESDFVEKEMYRYPKAVAEVFSEEISESGLIQVIDVGTGTGLTGMYLSHLFPTIVIDGIDISPEMLGQASMKQKSNGEKVYRDLFERDLTLKASTPGVPYDGLICSGTFTHGHLGPSAIENLISLVRHDGQFVIGVNNEHFIESGFETTLKRLVDQAEISEPKVKVIDVYEKGSKHFGDKARVLIFGRR